MTTLLAFIGRLLIALLFIVSGANKLMDISGTDTMIRAAGLPGGLALLVGLFEVAAGLALVFGVATRLTAVILAGFCLVTAFFFHNNFTDPMQAAMLLKNLAIAGGLFALTALDNVRWSYDAMRARRRAEVAELRAEAKAHDAEVRAARAEGAAEAAHAVPVETVHGDTVVADGGTLVRKRRWL
ncbi:DoxX family protein [Novosphingobium sp. PS1R-30]|uniref:DoxX family protein n=1 Tax=Novosphingobium anseongense TaxID=3133436 RepID=A0ABU8RXY4_9SPHN|nr:MAG: DoxX family protein [Novosphingobium sp.]